jgi:hypothetical protein
MKIHVYALCWNEIKMLPYFFRHYDPFVDQYTILDNGSDDGSAEFLARRPNVRLGRFEVRSDSFVLEARRIYDQFWKDSRGKDDWVIICNIDEHFYHPDMRGYLADCASRGVTAIPSLGYNMITRAFPGPDERLCESVRYGARFLSTDKLAAFNPTQVRETNFRTGRHSSHAEGNVVFPDRIEVLLMHFKYLGIDYVLDRHAQLGARLKKADISKKLGYHYFWDEATVTKKFDELRTRAVEVRDPSELWDPASYRISPWNRAAGKIRRLLEPSIKVSFDA